MTTSAGEIQKQLELARLRRCRSGLVRLGQRALLTRLIDHETATIDDVRAAVTLPPDISPKLFGSVPGPLVALGLIQADGYAKTTRSIGHRRPIQVWRLIDRNAALAW